ncbi:MAG: CofH family radical SAM protein [Planctomycetota bacterium]
METGGQTNPSLPLPPPARGGGEPPPVGPELARIRERLAGGLRLTREDGLCLFQAGDLLSLGALAQWYAQRKHGNRVCYVVNGHVNYTNYCILGCAFCSFYRPPPTSSRKGRGNKNGGYALSIAEVVQRAAEIAASGTTEIHCVGGLHPDLPFSYYLEMLRELRRRHPRIGLKFFSASEVLHLGRLARMTPEETLLALREAGLDTLPGGGAEILDDGLRRVLCPGKESSAAWLGLHRTAHRLGIRSNATMLYGHIETPAQRVDHILQLRELQDQTGGFLAFVPLSYHPAHNALALEHGPSALDELRTHAAARLLLDNFPHIKAYWVTLTVPVAQVALAYGATDFDGTVLKEEVHHRAGALAPQSLTVQTLQRLIREAGCEPVERNHLYQRVLRDGNGPEDWRVA